MERLRVHARNTDGGQLSHRGAGGRYRLAPQTLVDVAPMLLGAMGVGPQEFALLCGRCSG